MLTQEEESFIDKAAISDDDVVFLLELCENGGAKPPLSVLTQLVSNQNALRYFKFHVDQYCNLHRVIISVIDNSEEFVAFLKHGGSFHKVIRDREQFPSSFFEILLPALSEACCKFKEDGRVMDETSKIVQKCVFSSKEFECFLTDSFEKKRCQEKHSVSKTFLKVCASSDSSFTFKLLFYSFVKSRRNFETTYKMFLVLTDLLGFELQDEFNFKIKYKKDASLSHSLEILCEILDILTKFKVDLDLKIKEVSFSDFLKNILKSVMALTGSPNSHCFRIFLKIIEINPLVIESIVSEAIVYVMLNTSTYKEEYERLVIKILEVYSKLHRIQNFVAKLIPTLKTGIQDPKLPDSVYSFRGFCDLKKNSVCTSHIFSKNILNYFTECVINLASWQVINLFKTMLFHLKKAVEELPEVRGENVYIEILGILTCWLLSSVRIAEHTVAGSTVMKFVTGLEELKAVLGDFGKTLLQREHDHTLMQTFLNLCFHWAEIYLTLDYYSIDGEAKMRRVTDSNYSSCNLRYLHPYLSDKEWCLIAERINNFGEKPCKEIMQKLMVQKYKATLLFSDFNEEIGNSIIRTLSNDFDPNSTIFTDKFVINEILSKMPSTNILSLSETIVKDCQNVKIFESQVVTKGILSVIFSKISKVLKQKRKLEDATVRRACCSKLVAVLPTEMFLAENVDLGPICEILRGENDVLDLRMQEEKIEKYLNVLGELPVLFCGEAAQKLLILLLLGLHKDLKNINRLKNKCESYVISIVRHNKFPLLDLFQDSLLNIIDGFDRNEDFFGLVAQNIFKSDSSIADFEPGVNLIKENLKEAKNLKYGVIILNIVNKTKKSKLSSESKELCLKYKSDLSLKMSKFLARTDPDRDFVEAFALILKIGNDSKLIKKLPVYVEYCLNSENVRGCLSLFITILRDKTLSSFGEDFILKIWSKFKTSSDAEGYTQLLTLITTLIPNEQFQTVLEDLLQDTEKSVDSKVELSQLLKTWTCILTTNFNSYKTNILRQQLENVFRKLLVLKSEELWEEVVRFELSIIQTSHVALTASLIDFFLLTVSILFIEEPENFVNSFNSSVSVLESLLKFRNPLVMDRLPPYLLQYRVLLKQLCRQSSSKLDLIQGEVQKLADCAHKLEQLTKNLVECSKDMGRIAMYLVADILAQYEVDTLYPNVKKHLDNCIYSLISLCDQHSVHYLMRVLNGASTEIFKMMYENYKKYYRFTGKV